MSSKRLLDSKNNTHFFVLMNWFSVIAGSDTDPRFPKIKKPAPFFASKPLQEACGLCFVEYLQQLASSVPGVG
jgi:hypothetical protein